MAESYLDERKEWNRKNNIQHSGKNPSINISSGAGRIMQRMYDGCTLFESRKYGEWAFIVKINKEDVSGSSFPVEKWKRIAEKGGRVEKINKRSLNHLHSRQYLIEMYYRSSLRGDVKCYGLSQWGKSKIESRQRPGLYSVDYRDDSVMYRDPCHGDKVRIEVFFDDVPKDVDAFFDAINDGWYLPGKGWVYGAGNYTLLENKSRFMFTPDTWTLNDLCDQKQSKNKTMIKLFEKDGSTAVQTDAKDEREFLDDISILMVEMMDDKIQKEQLKGSLRALLPQMFDICCAYNNYKNNVDKKTLYTAGQMVTIEPFAETEEMKLEKLVSNGKS